MDINTWLNDILTGSPLPTTLGVNIFPVNAPPKQAGFYSVYQLVSSPPILTQDNSDGGIRTWRFQFRQFGPIFATVARQTRELNDFLTSYTDRPAAGIQTILEINTMDLPPSTETRYFCRVLEVQITEDLA
jgi:hypothetical protein